MERIKSILILCVLLACVAPALGGADWAGYTTDWDAMSNWDGDPTGSTSGASIDPGDVAWLGGTQMPMIDATTSTAWGTVRMRNGAVVTQTGGSHTWLNGTGGNVVTMYLYNGAEWNISGGTLEIHGQLQVGYNQGTPNSNGTEIIDISGDGVVRHLEMDWNDNPSGTYPYQLLLNSVSNGISIADNGKYIVQTNLESIVDGFILSGDIYGIGGDIQKTYLSETWLGQGLVQYSVVPEPATLALMGLGAIAAFRRKH